MRGKRFEILKEAVKTWKQAAPHAALVTFATDIQKIESLDDLDGVIPDGGTNLHLGLEHAAQVMAGQVVVFTDGEPSDAEACFKAAAEIPGVVNAVFCGDEDDREAKSFCDKLSRDNGGKFVAKDIAAGQALMCPEVRELLGLPAPIAL
jgi:hypothetical protein